MDRKVLKRIKRLDDQLRALEKAKFKMVRIKASSHNVVEDAIRRARRNPCRVYREFCTKALAVLYVKYAPASVDAVIKEAMDRGIKPEVVIAYAFADPGKLQDLIKTGSVDWELVVNTMNSILNAHYLVTDVKNALESVDNKGFGLRGIYRLLRRSL